MEIRRLTHPDAPAWAALLAVCFGRTPVDMQSLWHWFNSGPMQLVAWGAWENDRLVAQYSCLMSHLCLPGQAQPAEIGISTNMAVHPDFRGRGLVKLMAQPVYTELTARGCVAGVGFSNASGVKVDQHSRSYGYQVVGRLRAYLFWPWPRRRSNGETVHFTSVPPALPGPAAPPADDLVRFYMPPVAIWHRYVGHPFRRYRLGVWQTPTQICGVTVDRPIRLGGLPGLSLLAAYTHDWSGLLQRWLDSLPAAQTGLIHFLTTPASPRLAALRTLGLCLPLPYMRSPHYLTVKPLKADLAPLLLDFKRWDCTGGDIL